MKIRVTALLLAMVLLLCGCAHTGDVSLTEGQGTTGATTTAPTTTPATQSTTQPSTTPITNPTTTPTTQIPTQTTTPPATEPEDEYNGPIGQPGPNGYLVVIDAGHQRKADNGKSPVGPGSSVMKKNVSSGTTGSFTGIYEYVLNLEVAKMLEQELLKRGYGVIMVRNSHDVRITNIERAQIANYNDADAFIRIHANGSTNAKEKGAMTICQTKNNPYNGSIYQECYDLSLAILDGICASSGCDRLYVWETDTMAGINWSEVPVTIVEMGYMTNKEEDELLATDEYRMKMALGMANGLDTFFGITRE